MITHCYWSVSFVKTLWLVRLRLPSAQLLQVCHYFYFRQAGPLKKYRTTFQDVLEAEKLEKQNTLFFWNTLYIQGVSKKMVQCLFCKFLGNQALDFQMVFFSWKLRSICKFWIQNHFCAILRSWDICKTKWNSWLDDSDQNLNYLILSSHKFLKWSRE